MEHFLVAVMNTERLADNYLESCLKLKWLTSYYYKLVWVKYEDIQIYI